MKTIFWNVDTQYDFMRAYGKLYVQGAESIEGNLEILTKLAEKENIQVVNTADWHTEKTEEISNNPDFIKTFPRHCMNGTPGAEYVPVTIPQKPYKIRWWQKSFDEKEVANSRNIILYKDKFDVFTGTPHADSVLRIIKPERAIVYGVATNVCVDCAVTGLLERKVEVYVPLDAIKELPNLPLHEVLDRWKGMGAKLIKTSEVEKYIA
ncbi:cysteine hydrolase [Candidatus Pacearchaeota archaeon]|nr:cysteine hydrolase [Candidatus Pacearchaeota archaeon]